MKFFLSFLTAVLLYPSSGWAQSQTWNLPLKLSPANTKVAFTLDTTWHTVHGVAKSLGGEVHLEDVKDFRSIAGEVIIPVASLDSDNSLRDDEMREVMAEKQHKNILFHLQKVAEICDPTGLEDTQSCPVKILGDLQIRGTTLPVELEGSVTRKANDYRVNMGVNLEWERFGVEDPSIFIARVDDTVSISVDVSLEAPQH